MSRQRTKGAPVQFRLSLTLDAELEKRARAKGVSRSQYVEAAITRALLADAPSPSEVRTALVSVPQ